MTEFLEIRVVQDGDIPQFIEFLKMQNGNTAKNALLASRAWDPDETILGTLAACNLDETTSSFGYFLVKESLRGMGIGSELLGQARAHTGNRNIAFNSSLPVIPAYEKKGFSIKTFTGATYTGLRPEQVKFPALPPTRVTGVQLVGYEGKYHQALVEYDQSVHSLQRKRFLDKFLGPGTRTVLALREDTFVGYGCVQPRGEGEIYLGPLFADDDATAQLIMTGLVEYMSPGSTIYTDLLHTNQFSQALAALLGLKPIIEYQRMYTKHDISLALNKVYAFASIEVSLL